MVSCNTVWKAWMNPNVYSSNNSSQSISSDKSDASSIVKKDWFCINQRAFNIPLILETVIDYASLCNDCVDEDDDLKLYGENETCCRAHFHRHNLYACLLVSKAWMQVALPMLWNRHAYMIHLLELIYKHERRDNRWLTIKDDERRSVRIYCPFRNRFILCW